MRRTLATILVLFGVLATACDDGGGLTAEDSPGPTATRSPATKPKPPPADVEPDTSEGSGDPISVTDIEVQEVGGHDTYDRVAFRTEGGGTPGWRVEYVDDPAQQGSGKPVDVEGDATLHVFIRNSGYPGDTGVDEYDGPNPIAGPGTVREILYGTIYEGDTEVFVGVEERRPFRVFLVEDPTRVVLDVVHGDAA